MSAPIEGVWLRHVGLPGEEGHGGAFLCPAGAVDDWKAMGWEPGEPPEEPNPVVAENIAAQQAEAERLAAEQESADQAEQASEKRAAKRAAAKASREDGADTTSQE